MKFVRTVTFLLLVGLFASSSFAQAAAGPESTTIQLNDNKDSTYTIQFVSHIGNTWTYRVSEVKGRSLSHWDLGIGVCVDKDSIISHQPSSGYDAGTDGSTGFYGIKWDLADSFSSGEFSFTLDADYPEGTVQALAKAGRKSATGDIIGPICDAPIEQPEPDEDDDACGLGMAGEFNTFIFEDFTATSDTEGRLAAGGNVSLASYSVADKLTAEEQARYQNMLIVGKDLNFISGRVYYGDIVVGGSATYGHQNVADGEEREGVNLLPIDFDAEEAFLKALSVELAALPDNGTITTPSWGGTFYLSGDGTNDLQVFNLNGKDVLNAHTFSITNIGPEATVIINLSETTAGLTNMSLNSLVDIRERVLFNFYEATTLKLAGISVEGSILAPYAHVEKPQGVIWGTIIAKSWDGSMQQNHVPFEGELPCIEQPEPEPEPTSCLPDIDFEEFGAGTVITTQIPGVTISTNSSKHPAMIFDSSNPTGGDTDLGSPNKDFGGPGIGKGGLKGNPGQNSQALGKVLILSEDRDSSDPDDNGSGGTIYFTFDYPTDVTSVSILDIDNNEVAGTIKAFGDDGTLLKTVEIVGLGNNSYQELPVDTLAVKKLEVYFPGSGAIPALTFCKTPPVVYNLGDVIWQDLDADGIQDADEPGIPGVELELYIDGEESFIVQKATTDANGNYLFENLPDGKYVVKITDENFDAGGALEGLSYSPKDAGDDAADSDFDSSSAKASGTIAGADNLTVDGGFFLYVPEPASLGDFVWEDTNGNGEQDLWEPGVDGVVVKLYHNGQVVEQTTTKDGGKYLFDELEATGTYSVSFSNLPDGYTFTTQGLTGQSDLTDSDASAEGKTEEITLEPGQSDMTWDAGIVIGAGITKYQQLEDGEGWEIDPLFGLQAGETVSYKISVENYHYTDDLGFVIMDNLSDLVEFDINNGFVGVEKIGSNGEIMNVADNDYSFFYDEEEHAVSLDYTALLLEGESLNFLFDVTAGDGFGGDMTIDNQASVKFGDSGKIDSNVVSVQAVPEPGTVFLLGLGLLGVFGLKRKFKK